MWYSFTDDSFILLDQTNHSEQFVKIKNLDPETCSDLIMHPGMFEGQNEYALCISVTGLREVKRIKIVPGKQAFPNLVRYRTSAK